MEPDIIERYDRQIRLWGQHGQSKCSDSNICLINANSLGTEVLKGLCLAGIGSFTILDSYKLAPEDVGSSFLPQSCVGKNRAESVKQMMLDLNNDISGEVYPLEAYLPLVYKELWVEVEYCDETYGLVIENLDWWKKFDCVIACGSLNMDQIKHLSRACFGAHIPLLICKSIGFFGFMRSQMRGHVVLEPHPDNALPDFNLDKPFKDLKEYFDSIDLDDDSNLDKINSYPYVVIVYKYLKKWQENHGYPGEKLPNSYAEKKELKSLIDEALVQINKKMAQRNEGGASNQETYFENYLEASKAVNSCFIASTEPDQVKKIVDRAVTWPFPSHAPKFFPIIGGIKEFVQQNGMRLPISGTIPDMISSSDEYIKLQTIYAKKAKEDVDSAFERVQSLSYGPPRCSLYEETKQACKNVRDLKVLWTGPIVEDYDLKSNVMREDGNENEFLTIGLCLQATDIFFSTYGRLPGFRDDQVETDISKLKDCLKQMIGKNTNRLKNLDQSLYELCRYGGIELHATSAFIGGCIAQEVIKLVTNQYTPVDDTLVYNATAAETKTFKLSDIFEKS